MKLSVVILAAGRGKRMNSRFPKVLQRLGGEPMLSHVLAGARALDPAQVITVIGHGAEDVMAWYREGAPEWVHQTEQLGTGHAVMQALPAIPDDHVVLVLYGDVPLVSVATQKALAGAATDAVAVLTAKVDDPAGYGRIVRRGDGGVAAIVEDKDASEEQKRIDEINTGLLACPAGKLKEWLGRVGNDNAQGEYYLTDIIAMAASDDYPVRGVIAADPGETQGINNRRQLADAERLLQARRTDALMVAGVTLADPSRVEIRGRLDCGRDVFIDVNTVFEGDVELGDEVHIGPGSVIRDSRIGDGTVVEAHSILESATLATGCNVGPFARLRPGTELADGARIGNFVETKNLVLGEGSKVNHLSYLGDARVGRGVNVGAGTITCNYDGANKHLTEIGDNAFIGSDSQLVAPVRIGAGATIGAGSTISRDAPDGELTLSRSRQKTVEGWKRPKKESAKPQAPSPKPKP